MGRSALVALLAALPLAACDDDCTPRAQGPVTVEPLQPDFDNTVGGLAIGGASEQVLAQVFIPSATWRVGEVRVPVQPTSGDLIVEIRNAPGGIPGTGVLASATFSTTTLPAAEPDGFRSLPLDSPPTVYAGTPAAVVLRATDLSPGGGFGIWNGPAGNPYSGGSAFYDARPNAPGVWEPLGARDDLPFMLVVWTPEGRCSDVMCGLLGVEALGLFLLAALLRRGSASRRGRGRPSGGNFGPGT